MISIAKLQKEIRWDRHLVTLDRNFMLLLITEFV